MALYLYRAVEENFAIGGLDFPQPNVISDVTQDFAYRGSSNSDAVINFASNVLHEAGFLFRSRHRINTTTLGAPLYSSGIGVQCINKSNANEIVFELAVNRLVSNGKLRVSFNGQYPQILSADIDFVATTLDIEVTNSIPDNHMELKVNNDVIATGPAFATFVLNGNLQISENTRNAYGELEPPSVTWNNYSLYGLSEIAPPTPPYFEGFPSKIPLARLANFSFNIGMLNLKKD